MKLTNTLKNQEFLGILRGGLMLQCQCSVLGVQMKGLLSILMLCSARTSFRNVLSVEASSSKKRDSADMNMGYSNAGDS